ncbi:hypothetical protein KC19_1G311100 [Ceratodon purpureus]|uniref:Uncharacterized protein n=1 Tax=Ceratodon purpureus TaxID=3225 RepID=A0A8T0JEU3_CERPU|nr:hypothetical protein KC19_1G311100 [Ceratodon purpureus]
MAEEVEKIDGWGIFDRLKNLPHVMTVKGDLVRSPCKTSLQSEIDEEEPKVQEIPAPQEQQGDQLMDEPTVKQNESGEGGEEPEIGKDNDSALSNRDLLSQLQAVAVGIRDFEVLGAKPKLTELVGEVKDKRVRPKSNSDNSTKSKAKEPSETKLSTPKQSSSSKATSKAILKAASKVRNGVMVMESKEREKLAFSDNYLEKTFGLSKTARLAVKPNVNISGKKSTSTIIDSSAKKPLKAKTLSTKQPTLLSADGLIKPVKKEARLRESGWDSEDKLPTKKKAKVLVKSTVKQRLRVLPHERRVLPEAALAEVVAAKKEREVAKTEMAKLVDEIRGTKNDNFNDLPPDVTERWMAAHVKKLRNSFNFHSTIIRHALLASTPKVGP